MSRCGPRPRQRRAAAAAAQSPDMNTRGKEAACTSARTRTRRRERAARSVYIGTNADAKTRAAARGDMTNESDGLAFGLSNDPDG